MEPGRPRLCRDLRRCARSADGKLKPGATEVEAGKLGKLKVVNGSEILLGAPFVFAKDNIDDFDF